MVVGRFFAECESILVARRGVFRSLLSQFLAHGGRIIAQVKMNEYESGRRRKERAIHKGRRCVEVNQECCFEERAMEAKVESVKAYEDPHTLQQ